MRPETQRLMALLDGAQGRTRAVGGIVRDTLLGLPHDESDVDLATELLPQEVVERAERAGVAVYPTGIPHGTVTLKLDALAAEVTTLREDVVTDGRHAVVRFGTNWTNDAARRDFTLNALYAGMDGTLFDPLGGLEDCLARKVRFIGEPAHRIEEDRLRVYRFFRFSASHGNERLDPDGYAACKAAAGTLDRLAAERVGSEMRRMLGLPRIANTLLAMLRAEVLTLSERSVKLLHTHERRARRPNLTARLAILMAEMPARRLQDMWRLSNDDINTASAVLTVARLLGDFRVNEAAYRHPAALADGVEVAAVLSDWGEAGKDALREQLERLDVPRFPLNGDDLLKAGLAPGPGLGAELERLEGAWIESGFTLDRDALLGMLRRRSV
ncbi:MAG: CCA tRNA nucleotidyltransferase [Devosia sp.]